MGNCGVVYEDFLEVPTLFGSASPKWSDEIFDLGYGSVSAADFYLDIFGTDLEPSRVPDDYCKGEYGGIALEIKYSADGEKTQVRRLTVTQELTELYRLIDTSKHFCLISPISYAGKERKNTNARFMYALVIEVDGIKEQGGLTELFYSWARTIHTMPEPTYIVCSGNGLHLYFVFERPIALFPNVYEQLTAAKHYWTRIFWSSYVTHLSDPEQVQYEPITQAFRCVGSLTKNGSRALAFKIGPKTSIEKLNQTLPADKQIDPAYKHTCSLEEAKQRWPKWYERRIEGKEEKGHWKRHPGIYYNWIEKISVKATVGHRYHCLENLCSLGVQCGIPREQIEADCEMLTQRLERLTTDDKNHFTQADKNAALTTYNKPNQTTYNRKIEYITKKTGIPLTPNKRNGQPQHLHLQIARAVRDVKMKQQGRKWTEGNSRKGCPNKSYPKRDLVKSWREKNPAGTKAQCERETGLSRPTILKWWNT